MSTYTSLYYHLVFSTKNRLPLITPALESDLYSYLGGILKKLNGTPIEINGVEDHVHVLTMLKPYPEIADVLQKLKGGSSGWINKQRRKSSQSKFAWQKGYGAFTVSKSQIPRVRRYIQDQKEHHRSQTFEEEFRELLRRHGVEFDERYLWE